MFLEISQNSQMISCEFCKISKNIFLTEHLWTTASACSYSCLLFICIATSGCQEIKSNTTSAIKIEVLLQRNFILKVLTKYRHKYGFLSTKSYWTNDVCYLPYLLAGGILLVILNSFSWNERWGHMIYLNTHTN